MRRGPARRSRGLTLLEFVVCFAIVLVFVGVLLERLTFYQEAAEKAAMEFTVSTLKRALQIRVGTPLAEHRQVDFAAVVQENPVSWLETPMSGYRGEFGPAEAQLLPPGSWYFDRERRELVYLVDNGRYFAPDRAGKKRVRLHVRVVKAQAGARNVDATVIGLQFVPVEPYRWL